MKTRRWWLMGGLTITVLAVLMMVAAAAAKRRAQSAQCGNQMIAISFVCCLMWPDENGGFLPRDLLSMSNDLITPKILICPADRARWATNWSSFTSNNCSYEVASPGIPAGDSNKVFLRCLIHGHVGYGNGTVFDGKRQLKKGSW